MSTISAKEGGQYCSSCQCDLKEKKWYKISKKVTNAIGGWGMSGWRCGRFIFDGERRAGTLIATSVD